MTIATLLAALIALAVGALIGWLFVGRQAGGLKAERDGLAERFKAAVADLAAEAEARQAADLQLSALLDEPKARDAAQHTQIAQLTAEQAQPTDKFREVCQERHQAGHKRLLERAP